MELFGLRLKTLRMDKGLTQQQLADKLGIVKSSVSGYEKNAIYPSIDILIKLCKHFRVTSDYLLGLSESPDIRMSHLTDEQITILLSLIGQFEQLNQLKDTQHP